MKIKAAVFDMDGLMFDTERLAMAAWDYAGEKMGLGKAGYMVMKTLGVTAERADEIWREEFEPFGARTGLLRGHAPLRQGIHR